MSQAFSNQTALKDKYHTICRYCGSTVTHVENGYFFVCPVHGEIPPDDVGKVIGASEEKRERTIGALSSEE